MSGTGNPLAALLVFVWHTSVGPIVLPIVSFLSDSLSDVWLFWRLLWLGAASWYFHLEFNLFILTSAVNWNKCRCLLPPQINVDCLRKLCVYCLGYWDTTLTIVFWTYSHPPIHIHWFRGEDSRDMSLPFFSIFILDFFFMTIMKLWWR